MSHAGGMRTILHVIDEGALLLLAVLLFPVAILLAGVPLALLVRLVLAIAHRILG
jgi:hypothetical protein